MVIFWEMLNWPRSLLNNHIDALRGHMTYPNLNFQHTHEQKQGINFMLKLINLTNLDDRWELIQHITYWLWVFKLVCGWLNNSLPYIGY